VAEEVALAAGGAILQPVPGSGIATGLLSAEAGGAVELRAAANAIPELGTVVAPGGLAIATGTGLRLGAALDLPAADLAAAGDIVQAPAAPLRAGTLRLAAGGAIRLEDPGNALPRLLGATAGGELRLSTAGALSLDGGIAAGGTLALTAGDAIAQAAGIIAAPVLVARSVLGGVTLEGANLLGAAGGGAAGAWRLRHAGTDTLRLAGLVAAPEVALTLGGGLAEAGGSLRAAVLALDAAGAVVLEGNGHRVGAVSGRAGALRLAAGGPLEVTGPLAVAAGLALSADTIALLSPVAAGGPALLVALSGGIVQAAEGPMGAGTLTIGGGLTAHAAGDVALGAAGNAVALLAGGSAGGGFALATGTALTVAGPLSAGGALGLSAGSIALLAPVEAGGPARLVALSGGITQGAGGAGLTVGGGLTAQAAGEVALGGAGNAVVRLVGGSAGGAFVLATGGPLRVAGALAGETILLRPAGALRLDGAALAAGRAVLLAAPAGIEAGAPSRLDPRDPARRPVLILDTRRASGLLAVPDGVLADLPGLDAAAQPTQLALFGPASAAAAGGVAFDIAAGLSPVFLLLDGGPALGVLEAGRLGVLGAGGSAFLVGTLGGVGGEAAAGLVARSGSGAGYSLNGCAMGQASCGVTPPPPEPPPPEPPLPEPPRPEPPRPSRRAPNRRAPNRRAPSRRAPNRRAPNRRAPSRRVPNRRTRARRGRRSGRPACHRAG
jgi:hypothetical protein